MLEPIELPAAVDADWDVIVAGSSFSAMFFLLGLPQDLRVLVVEKGAFVPHEAQIAGQALPREAFRLDNRSGRPKVWIATTGFGGNSNCWWAQTPRFHPADFRLFEAHGHAAPWPLDYAVLEPFYAEVEAAMEIAGGGSDHILPRSTPFPFPPHVPSRSDLRLRAARPDVWVPAPTARANGGSRASCCSNGVCHLCPADAKFTIANGIGLFRRAGVRLLANAEVRTVLRAAGAAAGVTLRTEAGEAEVRGGLVALGTNAIHNAAILLRSGFAAPALGRYLHEQVGQVLHVDVDVPNYFGGTAITGHCYGFYDGPHRATAAAVLVENYNTPAAWRPERGRWTERLRLKLIAEDLPQAENRVVLDADGEPRIVWSGHSDYAHAGLRRASERLAEVIPFAIERVHDAGEATSEAHIQGTHRMGRDPAASVTDDRLRLHEAPGVYALGAGAFPTCSPANPTLTLSALALRAGRSV